MNAREAAYSLKHYLPTPKIVIPMHMQITQTSEIDSFDFDGFVKLCEDFGVEGKTYIHPRDFFGGKAVLE